ncbi:MAG: ABC transporter permease [Oscillospiraceae bacterium]|jgi:ribose transport system permease protein
MKNDLPIKKKIKELVITYKTVLILAVLVTAFASIKPIFLHPQNLLNMLKQTSFVAVTAFAATFIITLGALDLSVGSTSAVVGVVMAMLLRDGVSIPLALLIVFALSAFLGWLNGFIAVKGKIEPFLVTLATMNIYRGIAMTLSRGRPIPIVAKSVTNAFGNGSVCGVPVPVIIVVVMFILTYYLFKKSKFGYYVRCIGGNTEAARVAGMPVGKIRILVFTMSGLYACVAGLILASLMNAGMSDLGSTLALDAVAAVILGGTAISGGYGTVWGTLGGTLIMGALNNGMSLLGAQTQEQILVKGIVIILAVLMSNLINQQREKG